MEVKKIRKSIYSVMIRSAEKALNEIPLELLSIEECQTVNKESGEVSKFIRADGEVPRGAGEYTKIQISVKIPDGKLLIKEDDMEKADYIVIFHGLKISYIDSNKNVYFKADSYSIKKEG